MNTTTADQITTGTMSEQAGNYERWAEVFGRSYGWRVEPLTMSGVPGWAVRTTAGYSRDGEAPLPMSSGVLEAWFLSREHACRWVDLMIERS